MKFLFHCKASNLFGALFFLLSGWVSAQEFKEKVVLSNDQEVYDTDLLSKEFHAGRREALRALMEDSTVAIFFSAAVKNRSNDVSYEYHQDPNFYYLSGLNESDAMLIVFKNPYTLQGVPTNELLFLRGKDAKKEKWTGKLMGAEGAKTTLGFNQAFVNDSFMSCVIPFSQFKKVYVSDRKEGTVSSSLEEKFDRSVLANKDAGALTNKMSRLREIKTPEEIALMRKAINITCKAISEAMKATEPSMKEYDIEAMVEYVFKANAAEHEGYPSIIGAGANACVLHYETNRKQITNKDILVCDVGAEYHGYTADVTRTIPVKGTFSPEQKIIYNIVLEAQLAGIAKCRQGEEFKAPHKAATEVIQKRLMEAGIIKSPSELNNYFFHGTSHYLGLDVHDCGLKGKLQPNSVITVEPGIYIAEGSDCDPKWWNIGIRIEDDVLITENEPEVLSNGAPKTIPEIERLMKQESIFNQMKK